MFNFVIAAPNNAAPIDTALQQGIASYVGDGLFLILQEDDADADRKVQNVVIGEDDLKRLQTSQDLTIAIEDGEAHHMGDGMWTLMQLDRDTQEMQNVVLTGEDVDALLAFV